MAILLLEIITEYQYCKVICENVIVIIINIIKITIIIVLIQPYNWKCSSILNISLFWFLKQVHTLYGYVDPNTK